MLAEDEEIGSGQGRTATPADVAEQIKSGIVSGRFAPGQRLIESDLTGDLKVGRSKIREAFRILAGEGLIEIVANRGALVRRHSREDLLSMGRAREVLEGLAARMAAETPLSDDQRGRLRDLQARMDAAEEANEIRTYDTLNQAYHRAIVEFAGNPYVAELIEKVRVPLLGLRLPNGFSAATLEQSNEGHRFITHAILAGAPEAAEAAMRAHVRSGNATTASLPDEVFR
ncbi:FCD domain-containing protein [Rhodobacterales bacterium HKCCE2091]|nr:FCD domain-containing protein [Rhodobacterales bacterium HKCCE2091]